MIKFLDFVLGIIGIIFLLITFLTGPSHSIFNFEINPIIIFFIDILISIYLIWYGFFKKK